VLWINLAAARPREGLVVACAPFMPEASTDFPCPVCSAASVHAFDAQDWFLQALPGTFTYRQCTDCKSTFQAPSLSEADRLTAHGSYHTHGQRSLLERVAEPIALREAIALRKGVDASSTLVDIGCGDGLFIERLRKAGWKGTLRGVEPSPEAAANTAQRLGIQVDVGTANEPGLEPGDADVLVMRHVIEHLPDPRGALEEFHRVLPPGGSLYLGTPDANALSASVFGRYWPGWDPPRHAVVFTVPGLRRLLAETGFEVEEEHWTFSPDVWWGGAYWATRWGLNRPQARRTLRLENPLVGGPAAIGALLEVLLKRSTMYNVRARRV
jgi:SAM-dependent methyltransferase